MLSFSVATIATLCLVLLSSCTHASTPLPPTDCGYGSFYSLSEEKCLSCPVGHYNWLPYATSCVACPANTYLSVSGAVDRSLCLPCPIDSISSPGSSSCTRCPIGQVRQVEKSHHYYPYTYTSRTYKPKPEVVAPTCTKCTSPSCRCAYTKEGCEEPVESCKRAGYIKPPAGVSYFAPSVCVSAATGCPIGLTLKKWARLAICQNKEKVVVCPKGYLYDQVDRCVRCQPGSILVKTPKEARKFRCAYCAGNSVSPGGLATKCVSCPCGYAKTGDGTACFNTIPEGVDFECN